MHVPRKGTKSFTLFGFYLARVEHLSVIFQPPPQHNGGEWNFKFVGLTV